MRRYRPPQERGCAWTKNPIRGRMSRNRARSAHLPSASGRIDRMASRLRGEGLQASSATAADLGAMRQETQRAELRPNEPE
jgi:hypothetical protein